MRLSGSVPVRPVRPAQRPVVGGGAIQARQAAPAPVRRIVAAASDPLPTFASSQDYKNYVINLVSQARSVDRELQEARVALNAGRGTTARVNALQDSLDAVKLQLAVLRDNYPIPGDWTRSKWFFGEGFDKDAFWKEQVEAIPGKPVFVNPEPAKPEPAKPEPKPPVQKPEPVKPAPGTPGDPLPEALANLVRQYATEGLNGNDNSAGREYMKTKLEATLQITDARTDATSKRISAYLRDTLQNHSGNSSDDHIAFQTAFLAVQALLEPKGSLEDRAETAIAKLSERGKNGNDNSAGREYMKVHLEATLRHTAGSPDAELKAVDRLVRAVLQNHSGNSSDDHVAFLTTFKGVDALLKPEGTMDDRRKRAIVQLADAGKNGNDNSAGREYMKVHLETIIRLAEDSGDAQLKAVIDHLRGTLQNHSGNSSDDHTAFMSAFDAAKAMLA